MKKILKRTLSILMTAVMIIGIAPVAGLNTIKAAAEEDVALPGYKTGDIIEFGSYPQSKLTDNSIIQSLSERTKDDSKWAHLAYSNEDETMLYTEITFAGVKYRGIKTENVVRGMSSSNGYVINSTYWFRYDPIEWVVLNPETGFILCRKALDNQPFSSYVQQKNNDYYNDIGKYASDWESSSLKRWLNNDFYNCAFTDTQKTRIKLTHLKNKAYCEGISIYDGNDTYDYVFIPSARDKEQYSNIDFRRQSTAYASCQGIWNGQSYQDWWLRDADPYAGNRIMIIGYNNAVWGSSSGNIYNADNYEGICPAMRINLNSAKTFDEKSYIADIWLNQNGHNNTPESNLINDMMSYYSPSSEMYAALKKDGAFQKAVVGWNTFKFAFDPPGTAKKIKNITDIYESLILTMLEKASGNDVIEVNNAILDAVNNIGTPAKEYTEFRDNVDDFDTAIKNGMITIDTIKDWKKGSEGYKYKDFVSSFKHADKANESIWSDNKFISGIGIIADTISGVSDFYKRLCSYIYAYQMKEDMVNFLTEMRKQSIPDDFRTAINNVLNAVNNIDYAALICTAKLGTDLGLDVFSAVWEDISNVIPVYGFLKTVGDAAMAFDNLFFNTDDIIDKYYLLEATYNYFNTTKTIINNSKTKYLSNSSKSNAASYVFAMRNFQYAYEIDLESAVDFARAAGDEGIVNLFEKGVNLLSELITGKQQKTDYQKMSESADSIKVSLESLFYTLDTSWKFNVEYLKEDYPDVYPIYVQEELSKSIYTPIITAKYLDKKGTSNIDWAIPYGYTDKNGKFHHMSTYIIDGIEAAETVAGSTTKKDVEWSGNTIEFNNSSKFTTFPKLYSIKGYTSTDVGKVYTNTGTESFENPLKKPVVVMSIDSLMLSAYNSGLSAFAIYDSSSGLYRNYIKYKIYRRTDSTDWKLIDTVSRDTTFLSLFTLYKDTTANSKQNYYYKVSSYIDFDNGKRLESPASDPVCMNISDVVNNALNLVLEPIRNIKPKKAVNASASQSQAYEESSEKNGIMLRWNKVAGVNGYKIYRLASYGKAYKLIDTVASNSTSYIDENVNSGATYNYVVIPYTLSGETTVYDVSDNGNSSIDYIAEEKTVKSVSISDITINYKKSAAIKPIITADEGVTYTVKYESSNPKVATVDQNGNVYGAKKGSADIKVTVTDSAGNTVTDTCNVKVKYSFGQWLIVILLFGWIWY